MLHILTLFLTLQGAPAITIDVAGARSLALTAADLTALPRVEIKAEMEGEVHTFSGVAVAELLQRAGLKFGRSLRGPALAQYLLVEARDGYRVVYALTEFDSDFTSDTPILADRRDGQPLSAEDGPWRLILPREKRGARWVRQVTALSVKVAP
jgi:hypothetical protein